MSSENIGIEDARKRLGDLVTAAQQGTDIVLTRNGRPVARITRYQEVPVITVVDIATELGSPSLAEKFARFAGAFEIHDPRTGRLPKRWNGQGMAATFTRDEADALIAEWDRSAAHAEGMAYLLPGDADAAEIADRYQRP
jgi:prevent-host-death family protein